MNTPFYFETSKPTLKHQRKDLIEKKIKSEDKDKWYKRGQFLGIATKFRKGACKNCGSLTHDVKSCTERPRKVGAKYTGKDICPDEIVQTIELDYDGKRDRWNGYVPDNKNDFEFYEKMDAERRKLKEREQAEKYLTEETKEELDQEDLDDFRTDDTQDDKGKFSKRDTKARTTVRNLRIREDTAKYLRNLDPNSAYYAPKSRSMRENPNPEKDDSETPFKGENYVRFTGETTEFYNLQKFAWSLQDKGEVVNPASNPSLAEMKYKEHKEETENKSKKIREDILNMYGGEEHLQPPPKELLVQYRQ